MMSAATPADVDAHLRSLISALDEKSQQLADAANELRRAEKQWRHHADQALGAAALEAERTLKRERKGIDANVDELRTSALGLATAAVFRRAPGYLSADWADPIWPNLPIGAAGEWLRVGAVRLGPDLLPVVLPLSAGVWTVVSPSSEVFRSFVQNVIARAVAAFDPPRVRVLSYDPDLVLDLAVFASLRAVSPGSVPPALTAEGDFEEALETLRAEIAAVDDRLTAAGQETYWEALASGHALAGTTPLRLLIIGADTSSFTDRGVARLDQLRRIAADRGLIIIESVPAPPIASLPSTTVTLTGESANVSSVPGVTWFPDPWAGDRFIRTLSANLVERPRQSLAPTVDFEKIVADIDDPWMIEADEGLESVLGTSDGGDLVIRLRSENPPMPNALVGGAVGQGKSNLLHVLIHGLAAKYSPAELEMILVDLKDGVEFARFAPTPSSPAWLPHVRALGLEFDADYSLAVLRWVEEQRTERSNVFKGSGAQTLKQYHHATGKVVPRLLVVIDEFQRLFEGDDEQAAEAAKLLEGVARTGRSFGIHLVLASQAITGIRGLATKADAIFGQFHNRITLRNTPAESQAFLTAQNLEATQLEHRGEVVLNDSLGSLDANTVGTVAYADPAYLERLQVQLFQQGHGPAPSVFRASAFASWPGGGAGDGPSKGVSAAVGLPIAVEPISRWVTLTRSPNQALAVVGSNRELAVPILLRAVDTVSRALGDGACVTILDGDSSDEEPAAWVGALVEHLSNCGASVERVPRDGVAGKVVQLGQEKGLTGLIVAIALDSVDLATPLEPDYLLPNDLLRDLVKSGPLHGTWTIGWWQSKLVLEEHLGYRAPGVRAWAFAGVSRDDLTDIAGHAVREPTASPRFVWFDRTAGTGAERLVPFAATDIIGMVDLD